jgi:nudix-type nucleoside diphosphatase (YffH/AdpP family)
MLPRIKIEREEVLSDDWYLLKKTTFTYLTKKGEWETRTRETYDRGNGATILLYNKEKHTVILTRQFRFPTFVNGNTEGMLIETCAGLLDQDSPETAIRRETEEETGYLIKDIEKVFEAYMSPGSVTEKLYFFIAEYTNDTKKNGGGGIEEEEIDVIELKFADTMKMISSGEIQDGKTIMLLQHLFISQILNSSNP